MITATAIGAIRRLPTIARIALSSAGSCQNGATSAGMAIQVAKTTLNAVLSSVNRQSRRARSRQKYVIVNATEMSVVNAAAKSPSENRRGARKPSAPGSAGPSTWPATGMLSICE